MNFAVLVNGISVVEFKIILAKYFYYVIILISS